MTARKVKLTQGWFPIPDDICQQLGIVEGTEVEIEAFDGVLVLTIVSQPPPKPAKK